MAPPTTPPAASLREIRLEIEQIRQQNDALMQEAEQLQREVPDLIRIRAELIARAEAFEKDVTRRLDEILENHRRDRDGPQA